MKYTPVILAVKEGHKDVVLILAHRGADLKLADFVSVHIHML